MLVGVGAVLQKAAWGQGLTVAKATTQGLREALGVGDRQMLAQRLVIEIRGVEILGSGSQHSVPEAGLSPEVGCSLAETVVPRTFAMGLVDNGNTMLRESVPEPVLVLVLVLGERMVVGSEGWYSARVAAVSRVESAIVERRPYYNTTAMQQLGQ